MSMFNSTLEELLNVLKNSIHGPFVAPIIQFLKSNQSAASTVDMVTKLFGSLESCIRAGDTYQLLSFKKKKNGQDFMRQGLIAILKVWKDFIQKQTFPDHDELQRHSTLMFNIIFYRLMKTMISTQKSEAIATSSQAKPVVGSL